PLSTVWLETWPTGRDLLIVRGVGFFDPEPGLFRLTPGVGQTRIVDGIVNAPRITDDASWIYFWRDADILRVRPDGTDEEVVASGSADTVLLRFPDPAPAGDRLLYARYRPRRPSNQRDLVILDLQTRTTTSL